MRVSRFIGGITAVAAALLFTPFAYSQIQFTDVSDSVGNLHFGESWGASWGDINGDGLPDLFTTNHRLLPAMYLNNGNGTFSNITSQVDGSRTWRNNPTYDQHGAAWHDYDKDGDQDLMINTGSCCPTQFFTNQNGVMIDETVQRGIVDDGGGRMPYWFDYDGNGIIDLAIMNSGTSKLLKQDSNGNFSVVPDWQSGFRCTGFRSNYSQMMDIDNDNNLETMCMQDGTSPARVYDTTVTPFIDLTASVPAQGGVIDTVIGDFDNNLSNDIFFVRGALRHDQAIRVNQRYMEARLDAGANDDIELSFPASGVVSVEFHSITLAKNGDPSKIFIGAGGYNPVSGRNFDLDPNDPNNQGIKPHSLGTHALYIGYVNGKWVFQMVARAVAQTRGYFIITSQNGTLGNPTIDPLKAVNTPFSSKLHMNDGTGTFTEEASARGFGEKVRCVSGAAADYDNDMDVDIYLVCRGGVENIANILYENDGSGNFTKVANAGGAKGVTGITLLDNAGGSESVAIADYDVDGFMDLFVTNGMNLQPFLSGGGPDQFFRNNGNNNHWIQIDLKGTVSNADAVGAKVYATTSGGGRKTQFREQNGGYHRWTQNHQRIHFGLGSNQTVDLKIVWPSGIVDDFTINTDLNDVAADKLYKITEGSSDNSGSIEQIAITPPDAPGDECGRPNYNKAQLSDRGLYIWRDCSVTNSQSWKIRVTGGGSASTLTYAGLLDSSMDFSSLTPVSVETAWDILDNSDPKLIDYRLKVIRSGEDGFDFRFASNADVCFNPGVLPAGAKVRLGSGKTIMNGGFDLVTLDPCTPTVADLECGQPNYNTASDRDIFLWKDCSGPGSGGGLWFMRATAGGSASTISYTGNVTSIGGFLSPSPDPFSIEGNDILDKPNSSRIDFQLNMKLAGQDGFQFTFPDGSATCFDASGLPSGAQVKLGVNKSVVNGPFDLDTQSACNQ